MGRKISNPSKGLYIEVQTTNIGEISTKEHIEIRPGIRSIKAV